MFLITSDNGEMRTSKYAKEERYTCECQRKLKRSKTDGAVDRCKSQVRRKLHVF